MTIEISESSLRKNLHQIINSLEAVKSIESPIEQSKNLSNQFDSDGLSNLACKVDELNINTDGANYDDSSSSDTSSNESDLNDDNLDSTNTAEMNSDESNLTKNIEIVTESKETIKSDGITESILNEVDEEISNKKKKKKKRSKKRFKAFESIQVSAKKKKDKKRTKKSNLDKSLITLIEKYRFQANSKLNYKSMSVYFENLSLNVFFEELLANPKVLDGRIFDSGFMTGIRNGLYTFLVRQKAVANKVSPGLRKFKDNPFMRDQAIFLFYNPERPWFAYVRNTKEFKQGHNPELYIQVDIQMYNWNKASLPSTFELRDIKMVMGSIPTSRLLTAMKLLDTEKFEKMLLGNTMIPQLRDTESEICYNAKLNDSQNLAISNALQNKVSVIQGPPGSGKTSTIVELIKQFLKCSLYPIIVVAASNTAVDNIAEKFVGSEFETESLRIVSVDNEKDYDENHVLEPICLHRYVFNHLGSYDQNIMINLHRRNSTLISKKDFNIFSRRRMRLINQFVSRAKVVFTTSVSAGLPYLRNLQFPIIIMDEATQSSEPATLIPLSLEGIEKVVLVGDQKQLSCFALNGRLSLSFFERLLQNGTYKDYDFLNTQFRMHPDISEFSRLEFYDGKLLDGITNDHRQLTNIKNALYFWDTNGRFNEKKTGNDFNEDQGCSYINLGEARYVAEILRDLIEDKKIDPSKIGVVTPYSGQRDLITTILSQDPIINPEKKAHKTEADLDDITKKVTVNFVAGIMIASVDAFQGREKDIMIMSCVRSNTKNQIGFVKDTRRLNVALTRAKYCLIMVGHADCLSGGSNVWAKFIELLRSKGTIKKNLDL